MVKNGQVCNFWGVWPFSGVGAYRVNDTHSEKLFYLIQYKNDWLAASGLFDMFKQAIKFYYTFHQHIIRVQMFEKCDSSNRQ